MTTTLTPRDLGVPVKSLNWVRLYPGALPDGTPSLLASMGQDNGGLFVCDIDLKTGHCRQHMASLEGAVYPTAGFRSPVTGSLYIGSHGVGHLHRYDPLRPERGLENLGLIHEKLCGFPCQIDEAPDGHIYISGYDGASLTRFNPRTGEFTRWGRMDDVDKYFYIRCGSDGTLAGVVRVCMVHVVLINPFTGAHKTVGPVIDTDKAGKSGLDPSQLKLIKCTDGLLYISSPAGNFKLEGMEATPVDTVPNEAPAATLPDGSTVELSKSAFGTYRTLTITAPSGAARELQLDWRGHGTGIFMSHAGPDGKIYGSSILPEHFFRCEPDGANMVDLGPCSTSLGEAYSMGNLDGKIYIASYPHSRLSIYDPVKPYRFGEDEQANPRDVGRLDDSACRPRAMLTGPAGKVWIGSVPDYGMWGGTLAWYDPATKKFASHRHVIQDCSVVSLEWLPDLKQILVGTTVTSGSGTTPRAEEAAFVFWDPFADRAVATDNFGIANIDGITDLLRADDGTVYAVVITRDNSTKDAKYVADLVRLDVVNRRVLGRSRLEEGDGWPLEVALRRGPDGAIYGATLLQFYRIKPGTVEREMIWSTPPGSEAEYIRAAGPIAGKRWFFNSHHRLRYLDLA